MRALPIVLLAACTSEATPGVPTLEFLIGSSLYLGHGQSRSVIVGGVDGDGLPAEGLALALSFDPEDASSTVSEAAPILDARGRAAFVLTGGPTAESFDLVAAVPSDPDAFGDRLHVTVGEPSDVAYLLSPVYTGAQALDAIVVVAYEGPTTCAVVAPGDDPSAIEVPYSSWEIAAEEDGSFSPEFVVVPIGVRLRWAVAIGGVGEDVVAWGCVDGLPEPGLSGSTDVEVTLADL
jgi:hypothetical protein